MSDIAQLEQQILADVSGVADEAALEAVRVADVPSRGLARGWAAGPAEQLAAVADAVAVLARVQLAAVELGSPGHRLLPTLRCVCRWAAGGGGLVVVERWVLAPRRRARKGKWAGRSCPPPAEGHSWDVISN